MCSALAPLSFVGDRQWIMVEGAKRIAKAESEKGR